MAISNILVQDGKALVDSNNKPYATTLLTIDNVYPIGSIYMSVNSIHPKTLFGGEWEQLQNRFLLGAGSTYQNGTSGGSADAVVVEHVHRGVSIGGHYIGPTNQWGGGSSYALKLSNIDGDSAETTPATTYTAGVNGTGKNMPPYLVVYMWKRTA